MANGDVSHQYRVMFVIAGYGKAARGAGFGDALAGLPGAQKNMLGFYQGFVESVVLPNKLLFGYRLAWGELSGGLALYFSNAGTTLGLDAVLARHRARAPA